MNLIGRRRLSRLEKRVASVVAERKRREPEEMAWRHQAALYHATKLVTLILHGDPQIDEPLAIAWERALAHLGLSGTPQELLFYRLPAVVAALPGDTENAKIARVFSSAPSWLSRVSPASASTWASLRRSTGTVAMGAVWAACVYRPRNLNSPVTVPSGPIFLTET